MINSMYCFRDRVSGIYTSPFVGSNKREAVARSIRTAVQSGGSEPWCLYPNDHELYFVGTFDSDNGAIIAPEKPEFVFNLSDILEV